MGPALAVMAIVLAALGAAGARAQDIAPAYKLDMLVAPSVFHGIQGMKIGPDGALYVADIYGFTIWRVDRATGAAEPYVSFPYGMADDLAFSPSGLLAWTSPGRVFGRKPGGQIYLIADGLPGVNGIGFTRSGRLFVTQISPLKNTLVELDPSGVRPPRVLLDHTGGINGFRIDANDVLWGPQGWLAGGYGNIVRIDLKTLALSVVASGFTTPTGVDLGPDGSLYAVDFLDGAVIRVNPRTGRKTLLKQLDPWLDNLTVSADGKIYVSDTPDDTIWEIDAKTGATRAMHEGRLALPGGLAMAPGQDGDQIYVADTFTYKSVDPKTGVVADWGHRLGHPMLAASSVRFSRGSLLATSVFGTLEVIDPFTHKVTRTESGLASPEDALLLKNGDLIVAEYAKGRMTCIRPDGGRRVLADGLAGPVGVAPAGDNGVYVSEATGGDIVRIDVVSGEKQSVAQGLRQPEGLDVGPDGLLYVVEGSGGRVLRVDPATAKVAILATGLPIGIEPPAEYAKIAAEEPTIMLPPSPVWVHNGIAVSRSGVIYVSADKTSALYSLTPAARINAR